MTDQIEFDVFLRYVGRTPETRIDWFYSEGEVGGYFSADARIAWTHSDSLEFSIVGSNLFDPAHSEYSEFEVERMFYGKIDMRF